MTGPPSDQRSAADPIGTALAAEADAVCRRLGLTDADRGRLAEAIPLLGPLPDRAPDHPEATPLADAPVAGAPDEVPLEPGHLGRLHQSLLDPDHRHRRGVHYTPSAAAALLVELALPGARLEDVADPVTVCDPSCGGGVFLLAAADRLRRAGRAPDVAVRALHGIDLDPVAVEVTRAELVLWAASEGVTGPALRSLADVVVAQVVVGDALDGSWPAEGRLDVVVGNPPFGGQLARSTARDPRAATAARELLGAAAGYADTAGLFLVRALGAATAGGRIVLLQPLSFLASRDAGTIRRRLEERAVLEQVWLAGERLFGASVDVCAPVLVAAEPMAVPATATSVAVRRGASAEVAATVTADRIRRAGSWAPLVAAATGVPEVSLEGREVLGSWARATAGFRDEFYAIVPFVRDLAVDGGGAALGPVSGPRSTSPAPTVPGLPPDHAHLVTAGLVEPARILWGRRSTRQAGRRLGAPAVDLTALRRFSEGPDGDRRLAAWAEARVRPKVVVATQTRVVEAAVDDDGTWWASVPVISVMVDPDRDDPEHRWLVAAALTAPPVTAWAAERSGGTALAPQALKLSARQVVEVPLPVDVDAWREGARLLGLVAAAADDDERAAHLAAAGRVLTEAHDLPGEQGPAVLRWWAGRAGCVGHI